jgi:hypothetical protein
MERRFDVERLLTWGTAALILMLAACSDKAAVITVPDPDPAPEPLPALAFVGSQSCEGCHQTEYKRFMASGHPYKLVRIRDGKPPAFPYTSTTSTPAGVTWDDVAYTIGGYGWKQRFVGKDGYIITAGGNNQWNLLQRRWSNYEKDAQKKFDCGTCHTTGYKPEGNQNGMPGMVGTWAIDGVQCEACHGMGSRHAARPREVRLTVDKSTRACGTCHQRIGLDTKLIPAKNGWAEHRESYYAIRNNKHDQFTCVTCHDPHAGVLFAKEKNATVMGGGNVLRKQCADCHKQQAYTMPTYAVNRNEGHSKCENCHMARTVLTALPLGPNEGDIRSHLFKINTDSTATQFTADGKYSNPYITTRFACLSCHGTRTQGWARLNAPKIHGRD